MSPKSIIISILFVAYTYMVYSISTDAAISKYRQERLDMIKEADKIRTDYMNAVMSYAIAWEKKEPIILEREKVIFKEVVKHAKDIEKTSPNFKCYDDVWLRAFNADPSEEVPPDTKGNNSARERASKVRNGNRESRLQRRSWRDNIDAQERIISELT